MIKARPSDIYRHLVNTAKLREDAAQRAVLEHLDILYLSVQRQLRRHPYGALGKLFQRRSLGALGDLMRRRPTGALGHWLPQSPVGVLSHWLNRATGLFGQSELPLETLPPSLPQPLPSPMLTRRRLSEPVAGSLYLHGGVGRGKSQLMNIARQSLPEASSVYLHYHELMAQAHKQLIAFGDRPDPMPAVVEGIVGEAIVLFVDEFVVVDIADAMMMSGLLTALFDSGRALVATSNFLPDDLYRSGLQRARFEAAVTLIHDRTTVLELADGSDYRREKLMRQPVYICATDGSGAQLSDVYTDLTGASLEGCFIDIGTRRIKAVSAAAQAIWLRFDILCGSGRSRADFQELAVIYPVMIIEGVYAMDDSHNDRARRFIYLIDILYENKVKVVISAQVPADELYTGQRLHAEFERTRSRIFEMCSPQWLGRAHAREPSDTNQPSTAPTSNVPAATTTPPAQPTASAS
ncbi:MAG: cell division protein ZapE [Proteobacteria bacterium]|nr:cell division protein ZapE [Pseudomonadota bacterium]